MIGAVAGAAAAIILLSKKKEPTKDIKIDHYPKSKKKKFKLDNMKFDIEHGISGDWHER